MAWTRRNSSPTKLPTYQDASTRLIRLKPRIPSTNATNAEVREFVRDYFLFINDEIDVAEAERRASKLQMNGHGLYAVQADGLKTLFGPEGVALWDFLETGYLRGAQDTKQCSSSNLAMDAMDAMVM
ncbi:hypothetical protein ACLMJK_008851 [Lecanora helva]